MIFDICEVPDHVIDEAAAIKRISARIASGLNCQDPDHWGCPRCEPDEYLDQMSIWQDGKIWWAEYAGIDSTGWDEQSAKRRLLEKLRRG